MVWLSHVSFVKVLRACNTRNSAREIIITPMSRQNDILSEPLLLAVWTLLSCLVEIVRQVRCSYSGLTQLISFDLGCYWSLINRAFV